MTDLFQADDATDAVVDIETLGRRPGCPVLSIGACAFRLDNDAIIEDMFYQAVTVESCLELGMRIDADTLVNFWLKQTPEAQRVLHDENAVKLPHALDAFTDWLGSRPIQLWGNSARFDLGIIEAAYVICGKQVPWNFWDERCYRTVKNLPGAKAVPLTRIGEHHNALDDAVTQAYHLRQLMRHLNLIPAATPAN